MNQLWPDGARTDQHGEIWLGGCNISTLAQTYGTPLYIYDEMTLARAHRLTGAHWPRTIAGRRWPRTHRRRTSARQLRPCSTRKGSIWMSCPAANWRWRSMPVSPPNASTSTATTNRRVSWRLPWRWAWAASSWITSTSLRCSHAWRTARRPRPHLAAHRAGRPGAYPRPHPDRAGGHQVRVFAGAGRRRARRKRRDDRTATRTGGAAHAHRLADLRAGVAGRRGRTADRLRRRDARPAWLHPAGAQPRRRVGRADGGRRPRRAHRAVCRADRRGGHSIVPGRRPRPAPPGARTGAVAGGAGGRGALHGRRAQGDPRCANFRLG